MRGPGLGVVLLLVTPLLGCIMTEEAQGAVATVSASATFSSTAVWPGEYDRSGPYSRVLVPGPYAALPDEVLVLSSLRDGEPIQVGVVRPDVPKGTKVPVLVFSGPYIRDLSRVPVREGHLVGDPFVQSAVENLVPHGYAVALVAARGVGGSGGCYTWWGEAEADDLDQAVTWLATRPWSNGNVALTGKSLTGAASWLAASRGNPHVRTIVPVASEADFHSWFVRNGTVMVADTAVNTPAFFVIFGQDPRTRAMRPLANLAADCEDVPRGALAALATTATGERDPFGFNDARDLRPGVEANYRGSVLVVHGFRDGLAYPHLVHPWVDELEREGIVVKQILGQWGHVAPDEPKLAGFADGEDNPTRRWDFAETLLRWLDHWTRCDAPKKDAPGHGPGAHGRANAASRGAAFGAPACETDLGAKVQVADSSLRWRTEEAWPPSDAVRTTFHLAPGGVLAPAPSRATGQDVVAPDAPRMLTALPPRPMPGSLPCETCVRFATEPFMREFRFAGLPQVHLTVRPTGPGGHVTAALYAERSGSAVPLAYGQMDLRFADGGDVARPVMPGAPLLLRLELEPTDAVVPQGGRLVLVLSQGGYGERLHMSNPTAATGGGYYRSPAPTWPVLVETGGEQSLVRVLAFERAPDDARFFDAP